MLEPSRGQATVARCARRYGQRATQHLTRGTYGRRTLRITLLAGLLAAAGCSSDSEEAASPAAGATDGTTSADTWGSSDTSSSPGNFGDAGSWTSADSGGWTGADGTDGTTGTDSTDGWWGGTDGTDGTDGWDGTTGTSGTGGTSGSNPPPTGPNGECLPQCNGKQCGPDGCGGSCGWCSGADSCQGGLCVPVDGCTPDCASAMVGADDGCGGVCSGGGFGIGLVPGGAQDAAYFRSQVAAGDVPEPHLLPIEGWLTEHGTALPPPKSDRLVTLHAFAGLFYDPAQGEPTVAIQLGMNSGLSPEAIEEGQFNLSVVIDRSGSMAADGKMAFVKQGLIKMLDALDENDLLSIVTYSSTAQVVMEPTPVADKAAIIDIINGIQTGGQTNLWGGLELGYEQVTKNAAKKYLTPRVILLSDGLVNAGLREEDDILNASASYNAAGIGVTTIGVGDEFNFQLMHLLATNGSGNFYFLDTAQKLAEVFEQEITYMLTPVADNLKVWFSLPNGLGVETIYGFEFKNEGGDIHLLGPSPQATIGPDGEVPEPVDPGGETPDVAVSTLFASKKNGLLMVKIDAPDPNLLAALENTALTNIYYSYELVESGDLEAWDTQVDIGSLEYDNGEGFHYFTGVTMQQNFCVLRAGLAMKEAVALWHESEANLQAAVTTLGYAQTFCTGINVQANNPRIAEDVELMEQLKENLCGGACLEGVGQ